MPNHQSVEFVKSFRRTRLIGLLREVQNVTLKNEGGQDFVPPLTEDRGLMYLLFNHVDRKNKIIEVRE